MKHLFKTVCCLCLLLLVADCTKYNDDEVWDNIYELHLAQYRQAERLAALEAWTATVNGNISALQTIVAALQNCDYVTGVTPIPDPPGGYYIDFTKSGRATILNGEKGADGVDG
ncbi:MAG: DUF4988 domain-containing protein, partial [Prevotellaceae bacterium]|nr:DUF4988 domain-containing protein [Prevotellaceae bacterium]